MTRAAAVLAVILLGSVAAAPVAAQTTATAPSPIPAPDPPGPYVIDLLVSTVGVPKATGFYPAVPTGTLIPSRAFGLDFGGHVYLFRLGPARVGLGADLFRLRGTAAPPAPEKSASGTTPAARPEAQETPDIKVTVTTIAPQISLNFGASTGWSYVSAGLGRASIVADRSLFDDGDAERRESGQVSSLNFGGGARWFTSDHLAFSFDIRFHLLSPGKSQEIEPGELAPGSPRTRIVSASAGISIR